MEIKIEVEYKGALIKGFVLKEDKDYITIKLSSGYNSTLKKVDIKEISRKNLEKKNNASKKALENNDDLPKIAILHTGGTIASKVDYETGAVTSKSTPEELLSLYPEITQLASVHPEMIGNILSGDLNIAHWNIMLKKIEEIIKDGNFSGIIISHGTDTLSYTAPALQYAIKNLPIPIILVGSQRSSDRPGADAYLNLKRSVEFIVSQSKEDKQYRRVGVGMYTSISDDSVTIFDAINVKKTHSSRRDAFKQINYASVAEISSSGTKFLRGDLLENKPNGPCEFTYFNEGVKIGIFKAHPSLRPEEISMLSYYDAVIIEGTGFGNLHVNEVDDITRFGPKNLEALKKLQETTKVVITSQTGSGETALNVYSYGVKIRDTGVLGNFMNLISESQYSRLAYCLSKKDEGFDTLWNSNLEGFELVSLDIDKR
ncbi:MAG: Glu-tRNA(Gln) amidotransferase subunit GatD [Nanoarchaeota archaeon]|nr:Glu-tRNA(Gln) amidotransferase subunit GatD [Nanoarchaeota archaeon]